MQKKAWEYKNTQLENEDIRAFSEKFNLPPAICVILMNRGITTEEKVKAYLKKGLDCVHNPFLLNDMDAAVDRILSAVSDSQKITVYGDYDVDGITAVSVLYTFLKKAGADVDYYIPDRAKEGYGLNVLAINRIAKNGTKLLISVDCGITSVGEVEFAKTQGLDVIITDHHTCKQELPRAVAVIDPKRPDSTYPFDGLAGVGVAFKLVLALAVRLGMDTKSVFYEYADLTALGTIADVVPLLDENRIIADKGLSVIEAGKNTGITALKKAAGVLEKTPDSTMVAFALAPRLNAAGRLEHANVAVELLTCGDVNRAEEIADFLQTTNVRRQAIEQEIFKQATEQVYSFGGEQLIYVLSGKEWHPGVIGIVASKICESLYRPCILISCSNGKGKGSGRSVEEFNLFSALTACEEFLSVFGGHSQAAGLSLDEDKIDEFRKSINEYAKAELKDVTLIPKLKIDCSLEPQSINLNAAKMIAHLEPFGCGNEIPVFSASGLKILSASKMGADSKHLRMRLAADNFVFSAVGFGMGDACDEFCVGDTVNIAFNMGINYYQGKENLQLILKDITN